MSAINLEDYKNLKRSRTIVSELKAILRILTLTIRGLKGFSYYQPVKDVLSHLKDAKTILEIHLNHHSRLVEKGKSNEE